MGLAGIGMIECLAFIIHRHNSKNNSPVIIIGRNKVVFLKTLDFRRLLFVGGIYEQQ